MAFKVLFFSGSLRRNSMNCQIAKFASKIAEKELQIEPLFLSLKDFDIPLYDGDLEAKEGMPDGALKLKKLFIEASGIYIASPEYNGAFSGALKNAIDWISRPNQKNELILWAFRNKNAAISSATAGKFGGINGMNALRLMLSNIGINVIPNQLAIPEAHNVLDAEGNIIDKTLEESITVQVKQLCELIRKVSAA